MDSTSTVTTAWRNALPLVAGIAASAVVASLLASGAACAADSVSLSEYYSLTRTARRGELRLELQARAEDGRMYNIGSIPDPAQGRLAFERLLGAEIGVGRPMVIVSPDGRAVAFYHRSELSRISALPKSGVYHQEYGEEPRLLHAGENIVGIPFANHVDAPSEVLSFKLLKVPGGWTLVPWAVTLTPDGPGEFPLAMLGATDLHRAAYRGDVASIAQSLDNGLDVDARTHWGHTSLYVAIVSYEEPAAIALVERGATLTSGNFDYLHLAVMHGQSALIDVLVDHGLDVNAVDSVGATPLHAAAAAYRRGVNEEIFGQRGRISPAAAVRRVTTLLARGADASATGNTGSTVLHALVRNDGQHQVGGWVVETAKLLVDAGAIPAARNAQGNTPLHVYALGRGFGGLAPARNERVLAAEAGAWEASAERALLDLLVAGVPDIDARNSDGLTPLQLALRSSHMLTAQYLVARGADDGVLDTNGVSARERIAQALTSGHWSPATPR